jgi:hypothetical protein
VLNAPLAVGAQAVEPKTVFIGFDLGDEASSQGGPLCGINLAFEHRILDALSKIKTGF